MKNFLLFAVMIAGALAAYHHFSQAEEASATRRLSIFVDERIDEMLGPIPLTSKGRRDLPPEKHDILRLQQDIQDLKATARPKERLAVSTAVKLCSMLLQTAIVKEQHIARVNDSRAKNFKSTLDRNPEAAAAGRQRFFEDAITASWAREATKSRAEINRVYEQLREAER